MASAADRATAGITCVYRSDVMAVVECPSRSLTTLMSTPAASARLAWVCLRSWSRILGRPAAWTSRLKRSEIWSGLSRVPSSRLKTTPRSVQPSPHCSRSWLWLVRCSARTWAVRSSMGTTRAPAWVFGAPSCGPFPASVTCQRTTTCGPAGWTSSQCSPMASPRRMPVKAMRWKSAYRRWEALSSRNRPTCSGVQTVVRCRWRSGSSTCSAGFQPMRRRFTAVLRADRSVRCTWWTVVLVAPS